MTWLRVCAAIGMNALSGSCLTAQTPKFTIPVTSGTLSNGLRYVLSTDHKTPIVTVAVYYHIGFRIEPRDRTGFAHLFEHLMFQGSRNLGKLEFIKLVQSNGGVLNGSTRFDFTNYFEIVPSNTLQTFLWAEADRMRSLAITQDNLTNQQGVVKSEVRVNVLNRPYGGFPWLDMPQYANTNWYNAHNFYGDLRDIDAATLTDAEAFHKTYYSPGNAVVVVTGDLDVAQAKGWIEQYFASIPAAPLPKRPDLTEPKQEKEIRANKTDSLASRPALAFSYHMPPRNTPEFFAMGYIDQILLQGHDAKLYQALVQRGGVTGDVSGGINLLGNQFDYEGPMLWTVSLFHDAQHSPDEILKLADAVIDSLRTVPIDAPTLARARVKERAAIYDVLGGQFGFGRADLLACYALFDHDPGYVDSLEGKFQMVTPAVILRTAKEYLRPTNRTVLTIVPGKTANGAVGN
ncbi:MAG TPA: pitrilysin family protein [Gemmatimonadaceae bacterium]|nr:pitrilysin family protein [Gemmatimonadaceae bacterium]